jgi:hypothetical protein
MKLRFSIRDLMWLTLVVALATGWWIDHQQQEERYKNKPTPFHAPIPFSGSGGF